MATLNVSPAPANVNRVNELDALVRLYRRMAHLLDDDTLVATRGDSMWCLQIADAEAGDWPAAVTSQSRADHQAWVRAVDLERADRAGRGLRRPAQSFGFSPEFLDELKHRVPVEVEIGRVVNLQRRGRTLVGRCPLHDDHDPSLTIWPEQGRWRCWAGCGHGDVFDWVRLFNPALREFRQAVSYVTACAGWDGGVAPATAGVGKLVAR